MENTIMRSKPTPVNEQLRLVTECRRSGLTDAQWCIKNDISPSTFYNWTSRLKKRGVDLPASSETSPAVKQDVVRLDIIPDESFSEKIIDSDTVEVSGPSVPEPLATEETRYSQPSMELSFGNVTLRISNGVNASLLASLMIALKEQPC